MRAASTPIRNHVERIQRVFLTLPDVPIIFRTLEKLVPAQPWYEGGYRANIVTYTMAKVAHDAAEMDQVVDLDAVWRSQAVPRALEEALIIAAAEAHEVITSPPDGIRNMSEWAKQQACWATLKARELTYGPSFMGCLIDPEDAKTVVKSARKEEAMTSGIHAQTEVFEKGSDFWRAARRWGVEQKKLSEKEVGILETCASIPSKIPTDRQCVIAMEILARLEADGYQFDGVHVI